MPLWRVFKSPRESPQAAWWLDADAVAEAPTIAALDRLRDGVTRPSEADGSEDDSERRAEMIEGLERLLAIAATGSLPVIDTQHRVIGGETCHWMTPVTLADSPVAGKLFLTATRVVFAGTGVSAWAWHRVRDVARSDRDLVIAISGADGMHVRCNTYADALVTRHLAGRLIQP